MIIIGILALGAVIGFLPCYFSDDRYCLGNIYVRAGIGAVFGVIFLGVIGGEGYSYWYLEGLGIGLFLFCMAMPARRQEIRRLLKKSAP